ncbi:hypothetical protein BKK51_12400 [Rodentibacter trehalosifermentans]|uniref:Uncharacterized protein n=1 Tax=Rodentibacter trehalosifermentans TaxID=1908263 RepID=A0A1V3ILP2_9PAST|nr:hypothetical protein [Rodentibacter trehalosifermentans]OOF42845.1 hypothetical protein BKK51_12400 [Rodentibacter trehalosifermentans]
MHNIIHTALMEHLNQYENNQEKLNEYYQAFKDCEETTAEAITFYADLVLDYGSNEDSTLSKIDAGCLVGIGLTLKSLCNDLNLSQYGRKSTSIFLDRLAMAQGATNEN